MIDFIRNFLGRKPRNDAPPHVLSDPMPEDVFSRIFWGDIQRFGKLDGQMKMLEKELRGLKIACNRPDGSKRQYKAIGFPKNPQKPR